MSNEKFKQTTRDSVLGEEQVETHPSFGMIQITRISGGKRRLFGSSIQEHAHAIRLKIYVDAERRHSLGEDSYWPGRRPYIEVEMSAAQYAEAITTMNVMNGVPCTVLYKDGKRVDQPPLVEVETDKVKVGFEKKIREAAAGLSKLEDVVAQALDDAKMTNKQRDELKKQLVDPIRTAYREIALNAPFVLEQFERATERITKVAKAEVDALVTHVAQMAGIDALKRMTGGQKEKLLMGYVKITNGWSTGDVDMATWTKIDHWQSTNGGIKGPIMEFNLRLEADDEGSNWMRCIAYDNSGREPLGAGAPSTWKLVE